MLNDNLVTYWGLFILVFLVLNLLVNIMLYKEKIIYRCGRTPHK